ncbi:uncharacterized protein LOC143217272 [Lasioglossum baleicum]|uniref:uncharacterized protein LOC143217272 n=1 Tax=Lasioglossum baleicum TaxID=434251 RepID=UPI003FCDD6AD
MTTINEGSIIKSNANVLSWEENVCVPQQLIEVNELLNSINRRLEDCALEWQAEISRKQWKIFNSNTIEDSSNIPDKSLLARTYFTEKKFDEAFQHVLSCNKTFTKYIKDFIALLRREESIFDEKITCEVQTQSYNTVENRNNKFNDSKIESLYFPLLRNQHLSGTRKTKNNIVENTSMVKNSLADVIKAKVNFDTKFLGFEAVLHKIVSLTTSTNTSYICRYCSKILKNSHGRRKKSMTVAQRHQIIAKSERVTRSAKLLSKNKEIKLSSDRSVIV